MILRFYVIVPRTDENMKFLETCFSQTDVNSSFPFFTGLLDEVAVSPSITHCGTTDYQAHQTNILLTVLVP